MTNEKQPDICISLKALPEGTTIGQVQELTNQINSLFKSEVISLRCFNGANSNTIINNSDAPSCYAEELIGEDLKNEKK